MAPVSISELKGEVLPSCARSSHRDSLTRARTNNAVWHPRGWWLTMRQTRLRRQRCLLAAWTTRLRSTQRRVRASREVEHCACAQCAARKCTVALWLAHRQSRCACPSDVLGMTPCAPHTPPLHRRLVPAPPTCVCLRAAAPVWPRCAASGREATQLRRSCSSSDARRSFLFSSLASARSWVAAQTRCAMQTPQCLRGRAGLARTWHGAWRGLTR